MGVKGVDSLLIIDSRAYSTGSNSRNLWLVDMIRVKSNPNDFAGHGAGSITSDGFTGYRPAHGAKPSRSGGIAPRRSTSTRIPRMAASAVAGAPRSFQTRLDIYT